MKPHNAQRLSDYIELSTEEMISRSAAVYHSLKRRHSIRQFSRRKVPKTILETYGFPLGAKLLHFP